MGRCVVPAFSSSLRRSVVTKTSTGLVGLAVDPNGRANLMKVVEEVLEKIKGIPDCAYRDAVEKIFGRFLKTCQENEDEETIEDILEMGQLEEMIEQAHEELELIDIYKENKVWEAVEELKREDPVFEEDGNTAKKTFDPDNDNY